MKAQVCPAEAILTRPAGSRRQTSPAVLFTNLSLFAHDSQHLVERRGRNAKQSSIRVAQGKDQIGGARNREGADGQDDEYPTFPPESNP
jgi:hypothetical protein